MRHKIKTDRSGQRRYEGYRLDEDGAMTVTMFRGGVEQEYEDVGRFLRAAERRHIEAVLERNGQAEDSTEHWVEMRVTPEELDTIRKMHRLAQHQQSKAYLNGRKASTD